jgi:PncC family amidohydrolase
VYSESSKLYADLKRFGHRLVLAESCTAGRVASELGRLPGISDCFCGSFVVYRNDSKARWLGIEPDLLNDPAIGPVSHPVTEALALSALSHTPEATIAAAITGHLGPGAPPALDGIVYCAVAFRDPSIPRRCVPYQLASPAPRDERDIERRESRQAEAAQQLMKTLSQLL